MPSFIVPSPGGRALGLGAGGSLAVKVALAGANACGNGAAFLLSFAPLKNFVVPIYNEQGVGDRTAYGHIVTLLSSVAWFLYAIPDYRGAIVSMSINALSTVLQLVYVAVFLWFAVGAARRHALYVLAPALLASLVLTSLVATKLILGSNSVAFIAAIAALVTYIFIGFDVAEAVWIQDANNMDPLFEVILGLVNASASTIFGFLSTPMDLYTAIPNAIAVPVLLAQLLVYFIHGNPQAPEHVAEPPQSPDHEA